MIAVVQGLGSPTELGIRVHRSSLVFVSLLRFRVGLCSLARGEGLLKVVDDIVNVLVADRNSDEIFRDTAVGLFFIRELLVRCRPWMDGQCFGVADASEPNVLAQSPSRLRYDGICLLREIGDEFEPINNLTPSILSTLDSEGKNAPKPPRQVFLRQLMALMALQARIADPRDILVLFQPFGELQGILCMSLASQTQRFYS